MSKCTFCGREEDEKTVFVGGYEILESCTDCKEEIEKEDKEMTFLDLLKSNLELDCDLIIGDVDMPASFVWTEEDKITDYGIQKYEEIMKSKYTILSNSNIEIHCENHILGADFCYAAAGYISSTEYEKIFVHD
ncbi:hypothetical protein NE686_17350 [Tissierella carlieri]|uniref:Uncharacterized protein n=1 Tax=Tissierella carlieri TaxID=689904 RepID=A0ABT1SG34_9FIRM|nr:hypothetical protein [Tissierella carlieri]MCQ4924872.1 hypothetical protein [Tissierella carlieri]